MGLIHISAVLWVRVGNIRKMRFLSDLVNVKPDFDSGRDGCSHFVTPLESLTFPWTPFRMVTGKERG